ncbi:hypothetical protein [Bacillus atrophaeus]|uniref:hypothetical protein n=1 Tax=Bacillus atrophaeus TaxID=1452 RepID=UPI002281A5C0|nr:hypothetical protein [Bacillus atrophaeus]MCY7947978.1 hypothetical protein [Bacillus atrophaeus]MCY8098076.1 hypothetical protein [Bacillus atrophaeus]MCY9170000.1 hypothetical protein [Bacillus atrophaeus]MEC0740726.1 hypothetical protein [Bacillus atrophaeus]MEC0747011.1 hypothetical protein [Bacillus atrophaeus]
MERFSNVSQLSNLRGFDALTQGETAVEELLLSKCNEFKSKRIGFNKTRLAVLKQMEESEISEWVGICSDLEESIIGANQKKVLMFFAERIIRDHVTEEIAEELMVNTLLRKEKFGFEGATKSLAGYLKCGRITPVTQTYLEFSEENEKGEVIYYEPRQH